MRRIALSEVSYTVYILEAVCLSVRFELYGQLTCYNLSVCSRLFFSSISSFVKFKYEGN